MWLNGPLSQAIEHMKSNEIRAGKNEKKIIHLTASIAASSVLNQNCFPDLLGWIRAWLRSRRHRRRKLQASVSSQGHRGLPGSLPAFSRSTDTPGWSSGTRSSAGFAHWQSDPGGGCEWPEPRGPLSIWKRGGRENENERDVTRNLNECLPRNRGHLKNKGG